MTLQDTEIHTRAGHLLGQHLSPGVIAWKGIPYAVPPVGPLRWRPPQPVVPWQGVRSAVSFGPDFPQAPNAALRAGAMSEDCLYLNVWAPAGAEPGSLPVMVWLHGGGFVAGSGADARSDGERLAREGVVVVSFNYRSGVFGFLAHPGLSRESERSTSGNYGLLDQMAALRWVRDHIAAFGGDPQRVTAFGVSAGSASVALMLVMPEAQGLFDRAVLHSPGTGRPLATLAEAEALGASVDGNLERLRGLSAEEVFRLTSRLNPTVRGLTTPRVLRPICDGVVIPEDERMAFQAGRIHRMPLIVGTNADEGTLLTKTWPVPDVNAHQALLKANFPRALEEALRHYGCDVDSMALRQTAQAFADTQFNAGTRLLARVMAARGQPVWRYLFTRQRPGRTDGPHHGDEVSYVFGNLAVGRGPEPEPFDAADEAVSVAMRSAWVNFARHAQPGKMAGLDWPVVTAANDDPFELGERFGPVPDPRAAALDFLDRCFEPPLTAQGTRP
jgi:para-nitrobenzyl esterase